MCFLSGWPRNVRLLKSSTKMISFKDDFGDRSMTLWIVRNNVDQASLWKTIIMLAVGSDGVSYFCNDNRLHILIL